MTRARLGWALVLAAAAAGCNSSDPVDTDTPKTIAFVDGSPQTNATGSVAVSPLRVVVKNAAGTGVEGVTVTWAVADGGGSVSPTTSVTNFDGVAQTTYTYGETAGVSTVQAIATALIGSPVSFTLTATPPPGGGGGGGGNLSVGSK